MRVKRAYHTDPEDTDVVINSNYAQEISGDTVIGNLKKLSGLTGYATFTNTRYNNIRFYGDITVSRIEVEIVNKTYGDVDIVNATCDDGVTSVLTDLHVYETPYQICYGTESGVYTNTVSGFDSTTATIYDLNPETTCYMVAKAIVNGELVTSDEYVLKGSGSNGLPYEQGTTKAQTQADFTMYDPSGVIKVADDGSLAVGYSSKVRGIAM